MLRANYPDRDRLERAIQAGIDRGRVDLKLTNGETVSFKVRTTEKDVVAGVTDDKMLVTVHLNTMHVTIT